MTDVYRELADHISASLGDAVLRTEVALGELMVHVPAARLERALGFLRDDPKCLFKMLVDVCGVDYPERAARFDVVYNLLSLKERLFAGSFHLRQKLFDYGLGGGNKLFICHNFIASIVAA